MPQPLNRLGGCCCCCHSSQLPIFYPTPDTHSFTLVDWSRRRCLLLALSTANICDARNIIPRSFCSHTLPSSAAQVQTHNLTALCTTPWNCAQVPWNWPVRSSYVWLAGFDIIHPHLQDNWLFVSRSSCWHRHTLTEACHLSPKLSWITVHGKKTRIPIVIIDTVQLQESFNEQS